MNRFQVGEYVRWSNDGEPVKGWVVDQVDGYVAIDTNASGNDVPFFVDTCLIPDTVIFPGELFVRESRVNVPELGMCRYQGKSVSGMHRLEPIFDPRKSTPQDLGHKYVSGDTFTGTTGATHKAQLRQRFPISIGHGQSFVDDTLAQVDEVEVAWANYQAALKARGLACVNPQPRRADGSPRGGMPYVTLDPLVNQAAKAARTGWMAGAGSAQPKEQS